MGIRILTVLIGAVMLMSIAFIATSCNKPAQDAGAGAGTSTTTTSAPPVTHTSGSLPKLQYVGADW